MASDATSRAGSTGLLIGGRALVALGSSRNTSGSDYLVYAPHSSVPVEPNERGGWNLNAAHPFFAALWTHEQGQQLASAQTLLELKVWLFAYCWRKRLGRRLDEAELDIKFLIRAYGLTRPQWAYSYLGAEEVTAVEQIIGAMRW